MEATAQDRDEWRQVAYVPLGAILNLKSSFSWLSSKDRPKLFVPTWYFRPYPIHIH